MQISPCDTYELSQHNYAEVMPGVYACHESGRLVVIDQGDSALLITQEAIERP
ncbi:MAG: hypothetical protein JZU50_08310 [Desulfobulbaceae bacterium]|jgi:hypothetical protein|nr:hypothetical protein [Desulfobulbaceae bacterium]